MKIVTSIVVVALLGGGYGWKLYKDNKAASAIADDNDTIAVAPLGPQFNADSAYAFTAAQCDFGPRTMNSTAHDKWRVDREEVQVVRTGRKDTESRPQRL